MSEFWTYQANTAIGNPGNGNVRCNMADLRFATTMALSNKSQAGVDVSAQLALLVASNLLTMRDVVVSTRWITYVMTAPAVMQATWAELPISYRDAQDRTFVDGADVTFTGAFGPQIKYQLATLAEAKTHLQITDVARDAEVTQFLEEASALVFDYIGARADPAWDEWSAPAVVRAAALKTLVHNWHHRGDDSDDEALWAQLRELLMRTRDPALA